MAADFNVTTTADGADGECTSDCTLREAVSLAGSADRVLMPPGNYILANGELWLNGDTIVGANARTTFIDGANKARVLRVIEVASRVSNVTIRNGNGVGVDPDGVGGGIFIHSGSLLLQNSTVSGNTGTQGAGIAAAGVAQLIGVTVSGNTATDGRLTRGGGIATDTTGGLFLGNSTVSGNTAVDEVRPPPRKAEASTRPGARGHRLDDRRQLRRSRRWPVRDRAADRSHQHAELHLVARHGRRVRRYRDRRPQRHCQRGERRHLRVQGPDQPPERGPSDRRAGRQRRPDEHARAAAGESGNRACRHLRDNRPAPVHERRRADSGAYEYRAPTLRAVMQVVNDSGGTRTADQFSVHVRTGGTDVKGSPQPGSESRDDLHARPRTPRTSVSADAVTGYAPLSAGR